MSKHRIMRDWLLFCANPVALRMPGMLGNAATEAELLRQSDRHGVLPAFMRRFPFAEAASPTLKAEGRDKNRGNQLFTALLLHHGSAVMADAAGLPAAVVKGPVFAQTVYPDSSLRGYTDIDILAAPAALPRLAAILQAHGFALAGSSAEDARQEWKWLHRAKAGVMIEVQTNLVHGTAMRKAVSLGYDDIADAPAKPSTLLLVALVHAGAVHQYDRLQLLVDICHAAGALNGPEDERRFESMVERTGARLAAITGLELAGRLFQDSRCLEVAKTLKPARYSSLAGRLLGNAAVTTTMGERRSLYSWRRQIVRELFKKRGRSRF
jgi:hypothetical protein